MGYVKGIFHSIFASSRYDDMEVKRCARTSGMQTRAIKQVLKLKLSNIDFKNFANSNPVWAKISITLNFSYLTPESSGGVNDNWDIVINFTVFLVMPPLTKRERKSKGNTSYLNPLEMRLVSKFYSLGRLCI